MTRALPAELAVALDRGGDVPLAVQIAAAVREAAGRGALRVGDRVPATRALAVELGVSRTVTTAAYDQLLAEGWLGSRRGAGTFVLAAPPAPTVPPGRSVPPGPAPAEAPVDLRPGRPCLAVLDRAAWRRAWRAAGEHEPADRPEHAGTDAYRRSVADLLLHHRGVPAGADAVLATAGTSSGFAEVVAVLTARRGRPLRVAVEDPGYRRAVGVLRAAGAEVVGVRVDASGLVVDDVPPGVDAVHVTPAHQYPLGARLSVARRSALVDRARQEGFLVVEDDYDGELRYDVAPLPLLAALAPDVVVHLGTTGKVLTPTLGTGWAVAPPDVHDEVLAHRRATGTRPAPAGQHVVASLAADGSLARHLGRLRRELAHRRAEVVAAVGASGHLVAGDRAGAHLVVPLADPGVERAVVGAAAGLGITVEGLGAHHLDPSREERAGGVLVGWAGPSRAELARALAALGTALATVDPPGTVAGGR